MTREEATKTLKENVCGSCAYCMPFDTCDMSYCDNREAIKALEQEPCEVKDIYNKGFADGQKALAEHIRLCKEEQEPKTGHWECNELFYEGESRGAIIRCSKCGNEFKVSPKVFENLYDNEKFCNHCGAKMDSEVVEDA